MAQIQGLAAHAAGAELLPFRYDPGELGMQEVEIGITHCGICHSDIHLISNDWGMSQYPFIPGHEIIGTVTAVGSQVALAKGRPARGSGLAVELMRRVRMVHKGHGESLPAVRRRRASIATAAMPIASAPTCVLSCRFRTRCQANRPRRCSAAASRSITRCAITASTRRHG